VFQVWAVYGAGCRVVPGVQIVVKRGADWAPGLAFVDWRSSSAEVAPGARRGRVAPPKGKTRVVLVGRVRLVLDRGPRCRRPPRSRLDRGAGSRGPGPPARYRAAGVERSRRAGGGRSSSCPVRGRTSFVATSADVSVAEFVAAVSVSYIFAIARGCRRSIGGPGSHPSPSPGRWCRR